MQAAAYRAYWLLRCSTRPRNVTSIRNASARACSRLDGPRRLMLSIVAFSEVEQQRQRGLRTYFVEDLDVFGEARDVSYPKLSERDPSEPRPAGSLPGRSTGM
jgi:hypothetical protein